MFYLRKANINDIDDMVRIALAGKNLLRERGIDQWQKGSYPSREHFENDIENDISYIYTEDEHPVAICTISMKGEPSYDYIEDGEWLTGADSNYATVHRCAIAPEYRGQHLTRPWFNAFIDEARKAGAVSVRIDTHEKNIVMQHSLEGVGFKRCGTIYLASGENAGDPRWGYEKLL